jgi:bifunctional UDP-N-acetylglucosamine pyrophosphorylase/glucosamine-1-phosphate N-acetyltransferase
MSTTAIILAAGVGKRMKSDRPKPLHEVCGRPMLDYILDACFGAGCERVLVVVGFGKEQIVANYAGDPRIEFVEQAEQLGTGHAARICVPHLPETGDVVILAGDVPLIRSQVLTTLMQEHRSEGADASMATAVLNDPTGYGRIVRDERGEFLDIVEQVDCTTEQAAIHEVFPSYYCVKVGALRTALAKLTNHNRKGEYYLTDIFGILRRDGAKILAIQAVTEEDVLAPNSRQQLAAADLILQQRIQAAHRDAGVTIVSSEGTYIESGVSIDPDTTIYPFTYIGRGARIGRNCTIGPFALVARDSLIPEGTTFSAVMPGMTPQ